MADYIRLIRKAHAAMMAAPDEKERRRQEELKKELKDKLPSWVFMVRHIEPSEKTVFGKPVKGVWRKGEHAYLNGLCVLDVDHWCEDPRKAFIDIVDKWNGFEANRELEKTLFGPEEVPGWCGAFMRHFGILFCHVSPSGDGLHFVFKADPQRGNIADNQAWLAAELGLPFDQGCKDSVRFLYCCTREDIIYIELENLLSYDNPEFEQKFGDQYRHGNSAATHKGGNDNQRPAGAAGRPADKAAEGSLQNDADSRQLAFQFGAEAGQSVSAADGEEPINIATNDQGEYLFKGVPYQTICNAWLRTEHGGQPVEGERNTVYYAMVQKLLRYICDFNADVVVRVAPDFGLPEQERRQAAMSAIGARRMVAMPQKLRSFLEGVGVPLGSTNDGGTYDGSGNAVGTEEATQWPFERWAELFSPWFETKVWAPVCATMPRYSRLNGMLAAGSMFGTLLSGVRLRNWYDGSDLSLTYMTYIIGDAGTGKGDYRELDRLIMEPLRQADARGRKAEEAYLQEMKRLAMAKAKKDDVPEEKHFAVRYLPTDTTLKQKLERCRYALHQFGAEQRQVACWNFESELSSKVNYERQSWNSSQDFDKKSFDREETGSESRSTMTTTGLVPAFFNFLVTGTPDALARKINARNCLDGLPTRLIMGMQYGQRYEMLDRSARRRPDKASDWLRTVGTRLLEIGFDVNLEQRVKVPKKWQQWLGKQTSFADALYWWGSNKAAELGLEDFRLGDYFRKRPPMIAVRLAVVDAILDSLDSFEEKGQLNLQFSSIELALHLADYIYEAQLWFFGKQVEDALAGTGQTGNVYRDTKKVVGYAKLSEKFTTDDVMKTMNITLKTAQNYVCNWVKRGYCKKEKPKEYLKLVKIIV